MEQRTRLSEQVPWGSSCRLLQKHPLRNLDSIGDPQILIIDQPLGDHLELALSIGIQPHTSACPLTLLPEWEQMHLAFVWENQLCVFMWLLLLVKDY